MFGRSLLASERHYVKNQKVEKMWSSPWKCFTEIGQQADVIIVLAGLKTGDESISLSTEGNIEKYLHGQNKLIKS